MLEVATQTIGVKYFGGQTLIRNKLEVGMKRDEEAGGRSRKKQEIFHYFFPYYLATSK